MLEGIIDWLNSFIQHFGFVWTAPLFISGFIIYKVCSAFLVLRPRRACRTALYLIFSGSTGMIIWVGDNNLLLTLPVFFAAVMLCTRGSWLGRLALASILFCLVMSVCAMIDTYLGSVHSLRGLYYHVTRLLRPAAFGLIYLAFRHRLPESPPQLSPRLWSLTAMLAAMPLCALTAVVVIPYGSKYDSTAALQLTLSLGLAMLPFVFLTSLALLVAVLVLAEHERLTLASRLAEQRESYYQALQRQEKHVRTLRHDLRNHITAVRGLLENGETGKAIGYLEQIAGSPAMAGGARECENETANAVLSAKRGEIERLGLTADFAVSLPEPLPVADTDLCALLGNALDNAMEAASRAQDKKINLRCRVDKGLFMLRVENAVDWELQDDLQTTKPERGEHGFGLACMREIAERGGGSLETRTAGGRFELIACIPVPDSPGCSQS